VDKPSVEYYTAMKGMNSGRVLVAHACNPSYSGSKDQEDQGLNPTWANTSRDPILKNSITKTGLMEWLKVKALNSRPSPTIENKQTNKQTHNYKHTKQVIFQYLQMSS
jgi:hypothetical protein